jgi:plasmid replication initiation protein
VNDVALSLREEAVMERLADIFERFQRLSERVRLENEEGKERPTARGKLSPDRHPIGDFFVADILDCALKDDRHSMEHPMFSLSKKPDRQVRHYKHNNCSVTVKPGADGLATIWDKDILIYAISQIVEGMNQGRDPGRTVRLKAYDLLVTTNRHTGGRDYDLLAAAFNRLKGTVINTDIETNGIRQRAGFGLIDNWRIIERSPANGRMVAVEITLNQWLYNAVLAREVLTLDRDYFRLDGGLERRLYEIGRKHCGRQSRWTVSIELLHKKSGSRAVLWKFREMLKRVAAADVLPNYKIQYDPESDRATFYIKDVSKLAANIAG